MEISRIKILTDKLQSDTNSIEENIAGLESKISMLEQEMSALDSMWDGTAGEVFLLVSNKQISDLKEIVYNLKSLNAFETEANDKYNRCEDEVGSLVRTLNW